MSGSFAKKYLSLKSLKEFYSNADSASGPYAGLDQILFKGEEDGNPEEILSQDFQTPEETNKPIFANWGGVYPVMHVTLDDNKGDGPSIDQMVQASKEFEALMQRHTYDVVKKNLKNFLNRK